MKAATTKAARSPSLVTGCRRCSGVGAATYRVSATASGAPPDPGDQLRDGEGRAAEEASEANMPVHASGAFPIELSIAVSSALERLSADQREAVVLKIYQGFKFEEMSEILSCPVSTVKSRLYTALELLKADLSPLKTRGVV